MNNQAALSTSALKSVIVVSFFPGNGSSNLVGGFDWLPEDSPEIQLWLKKRIDDLLCFAGDLSFTVVRCLVPSALSPEEVTQYLDLELTNERELPEQNIPSVD